MNIDLVLTDPQREWINDSTRELMIEGSAGSGKTLFACYKVILYALNNEQASIYVYRKTLPSLKKTSWKEIRNILIDWKLYDVICWENKSEGTITFSNGSIIYFGALDELSKVRSINADLIYIEQCEELNDTAFYTELMLRLGRGEVSKRGDAYSQMLIVVQPESEEHWIYKRYHEFYDARKEYENEKRDVIAHNEYYPDDPWDYREYEEVLADIQSRRKTAHFHYKQNVFLPDFQKKYYDDLKNEDYELWLRYSAGLWGKLTGVIFPNFDNDMIDSFDYYSFGIDYGFNHPNVFLLIGWYDDEMYIIDEVYETGLLNSEFIEEAKDMLFRNNLLVEHLSTGFGDAARPDANKEFALAGFPVEPSIKDVDAKISTTKQTKIHIHPRCVNTIKEIKGYKYRVNREGVITDEPVKEMDDAMDAMMYCCYGVRGALSPSKPKPAGYYEDMMVF